MRQILTVLVMLVGAQARGGMVFITTPSSASATAIIAQAMPVIKTQSMAVPSPSAIASAAILPNGNNSSASGQGIVSAEILPSFFVTTGNLDCQVSGDSLSLYGVASINATAVFQFQFNTTQPAALEADLSIVALATGAAGDDSASVSMTLSGGGMSITEALPTGGAAHGIQYLSTINPVLGAIYTLSLNASASADAASPLRTTPFPPLFVPAAAKWNVVIQQTPEPTTLALALAGLATVASLLRRR